MIAVSSARLGGLSPGTDVTRSLDTQSTGRPGLSPLRSHSLYARSRGASVSSVSSAGRCCKIGVEQDLQAGPQRAQFRPQRGQVVGGLSAQLGGQLATQLGLHGQLVLATGRDFPIQLQVVHQLQVTDAGLVRIALPAVEHRNEGAGDCGPQRQDDSELEKFHPIGENQCGTGPHREDQQRGQEHPTRPAAAAPNPGAAGQNGHGLTVPVRGQSACRASPAILTWVNRTVDCRASSAAPLRPATPARG